MKMLLNRKGIIDLGIYALGAFFLLGSYGAYKTHIGEWGKNGTEAVSRKVPLEHNSSYSEFPKP